MIDTIYSDPHFLQHHGVKGMKWGVRHEDPVGRTWENNRKKVAKAHANLMKAYNDPHGFDDVEKYQSQIMKYDRGRVGDKRFATSYDAKLSKTEKTAIMQEKGEAWLNAKAVDLYITDIQGNTQISKYATLGEEYLRLT